MSEFKKSVSKSKDFITMKFTFPSVKELQQRLARLPAEFDEARFAIQEEINFQTIPGYRKTYRFS